MCKKTLKRGQSDANAGEDARTGAGHDALQVLQTQAVCLMKELDKGRQEAFGKGQGGVRLP